MRRGGWGRGGQSGILPRNASSPHSKGRTCSLQYYQNIQPIVQPAPEEPWLEEESKEEEGDEEDLFYENYYINPTLKSSGLYAESPKKNYAPEFAYSKYPFPYKSLEQEDVLPSLREGVRYNGPQ